MNPEETDTRQNPERWLVRQARDAQRMLTFAIVCALAAGITVICQARLLANACHRLVIEGAAIGTVVPLAGIFAILALLRGGLVYLSDYSAARAAARIKQRVRITLYRRLLTLGPGGTGQETGPLVEAVTTGIEGLESYLTRFLPHLVLAALLPLAIASIVVPAEWRAGLVLFFSAPFIPLLMVLIGRGSERLNRRQWERLARMAGRLLDLVQGLPDLKAFAAVRREALLLRQASDDYRMGTMAILRMAFLSAFTLEFFSTVGTAVVAVMIGFRLLSGALGLADGLFVLLLAPEFYLPLRTLGLSYHARMQGTAAAEKIVPLLFLPLPDHSRGTMAAPHGAPAISFNGAAYHYGTGRGGVSGIDLKLPSGSLTALTGASGSGKTTLIRLLTGFVTPDAGMVLINDIPLEQLDMDSWRRTVAWVPQQPFFFSGTLRENLLLGCPEAPSADIETALDVCAAGELVRRLPAGLDTVLGADGAGLSGGELRRLALARALLRNARLVVLDEPTAGLDPAAERLVADSIRRLAGERTVLMISHREETVRVADRVVLLAGGNIEAIIPPGQYLGQVAVTP